MTVRRVGVDEARKLLGEEGYAYLDVRTVREFDEGHPEGAYNVPIAEMGRPNPDFVAVVKATFPVDAKLVIGCKTGMRSLRAAQILLQEGYADVVDLRPGILGAVDPFGRVSEPGWQTVGAPVSKAALPGRTYAELAQKK
ncbi:MAG: rhodanese-like domain-containing protein [Deltaproteobacteria bacterium]|nr:rhodanese-like domain-containing protein [Deltaproteobacteria bacterium]